MNGYLYILSNISMPGLLKIGYTSRSPEERRRELSRLTGIPIDFEIEYEIYSTNIEAVEKDLHSKLSEYRFGKEFFKLELHIAIDVLRKTVEEYRLEEARTSGFNEIHDVYEAVEILGELKKKYPQMIRNEIKSVRVYQTRIRCYLEVMEEENIDEGRIVDQKIVRSDLAFIVGELPANPEDNDTLMFAPHNKVTENARIFIEDLDAYSIINCTDLFTEEATRKVNQDFQRNQN
ncbi:MAG: GIY-YIG nuclease family protein [Bacteroidia bacterium]|nr:GIY-YIG nuclease family protein [Bacteroidia bacterium]